MNICKVKDCTSEAVTKGYCQKHYVRFKKTGDPTTRTKYDLNTYEFYDDYCLMNLFDKNQNIIAQAIIDLDDYEKVKDKKWCLDMHRGGYASDRNETLHSFLFKAKSQGLYIDHINGNRLDNRKTNIRLCTQMQNTYNRGLASNSSSGYKGVSWHSRIKKWQTRIGFNHKRKHLGYYNTKKEAALAYNEAAIKYYGEFARINEVA